MTSDQDSNRLQLVKNKPSVKKPTGLGARYTITNKKESFHISSTISNVSIALEISNASIIFTLLTL